ncbi:MAG TPA: hypothetical protein ENH10_01920 [Bacteroidetes bacterium]|nr:hypothetical protein [Bacteroidota bacterium]HEX03898.1 hypothetical protein [Bacteroidota bacterium]
MGLLCVVELGMGQIQSGSEPVDRIEQYYLTGRLDRAELEALRLLSKQSDLTDFERGELYRILAFSAIAHNDSVLAKQYFRFGLQHNQNLRLDRNLTSPKILSVFDAARIEFKQVRIMNREELVDDLKSFQLRVEGGVRSLVLPGLGQFHKGQRVRGNLYLGATGLCIIGLLYSQVMVMDSQDRYDRAQDSVSAIANYDDYSLYWKMRNSFGIAIVTVWVVSTLDAFISPPDESAYSSITLELTYEQDSNTPLAGLAFHF